MYYLISQIEYEGEILHGVFSTKEKANQAKKYLKGLDFDTQKYVVKKIEMNVVFVPHCEENFPSKSFV